MFSFVFCYVLSHFAFSVICRVTSSVNTLRSKQTSPKPAKNETRRQNVKPALVFKSFEFLLNPLYRSALPLYGVAHASSWSAYPQLHTLVFRCIFSRRNPPRARMRTKIPHSAWAGRTSASRVHTRGGVSLCLRGRLSRVLMGECWGALLVLNCHDVAWI